MDCNRGANVVVVAVPNRRRRAESSSPCRIVVAVPNRKSITKFTCTQPSTKICKKNSLPITSSCKKLAGRRRVIIRCLQRPTQVRQAFEIKRFRNSSRPTITSSCRTWLRDPVLFTPNLVTQPSPSNARKRDNVPYFTRTFQVYQEVFQPVHWYFGPHLAFGYSP